MMEVVIEIIGICSLENQGAEMQQVFKRTNSTATASNKIPSRTNHTKQQHEKRQIASPKTGQRHPNKCAELSRVKKGRRDDFV